MSKPSDIFHWADTVSGDSTLVAAPPSGKQDVGFIEDEAPAVQYINYLLYVIGEWLQYLSDGDIHNSTEQTYKFGAAGNADGTNLSVDSGDLGGQCIAFTGAGEMTMCLPVKSGDRIKAIRAYVHIDSGNTSAGELSLIVRRAHVDGTAYDLLDTSDHADSASGAGFQTITYTPTTNNTIGSGQYFQVSVSSAHSLHRVFLVEVDVDRP